MPRSYKESFSFLRYHLPEFSSAKSPFEPVTINLSVTTLSNQTEMASNLQSPQGSIAGLEATIGYRFVQPGIAQEALHAPGLAVVTGSSVQRFRNWPMLMAGNKRLAILGDTILQLVLVEDWYGTTLEKGIPRILHRSYSGV